MKKETAGKTFFLLTVTFFLILHLASAQGFIPSGTGSSTTVTNEIVKTINDFLTFIQEAGNPVFSLILGSSEVGGSLFVQVMIFFLVMGIIYAVLSNVDLFAGRPWLTVLTGFLISTIGIRAVPDGLLSAMVLPSSALIAFIVLVIPFVIAGYIILRFNSQITRRALWVCYAVLIIVLWVHNISNNPTRTNWHWIYLLFIIACGAAFWFDGTLQRFWHRAASSKRLESATDAQRQIIESEITNLMANLRNATTPQQRGNIRRQIQQRRDALNSLS